MNHRILVTGASGNIGRPLVQALRAAGADVFAGTPSGQPVDGAAGCIVSFDDPAGLRAAFAGIDTLFLLFPLVPNKRELARNAVAAARAAGVKHILRSSAAGADAKSPYALPRLQGEIDQIVIDSGIPCTFVRPSGFMQNYVNFYADMIKGGALYLPHAEGAMSVIDVRDIAAVDAVILRNLAAHAGRAYTVTGPEALTQAQAVALIGAAIGKAVSYVAVPEEAALKSMAEMGMDAWTTEQMTSLNRVVAAGWAGGVTSTVQDLTGQAPRRFEDFVRENVSAWR